MSVHVEEVQEIAGGFDKEIEESALPMIRDNLQISQYQFPVKSAIRELASNGVDSIRERDIAKLILSGTAKEEDFYIRRDDPLYKDSNFNPDYYDLSWLGSDEDVTIIYQDGGLEKRDLVRVIDQGVGLGRKRLEGYMKLGWSSKRNSKKQLGKFGIGAKAGLSTGEPYYTVITRYEGCEFKFNIYSQKIESIVPSIDLETGKPNPYYEFSKPMADGSHYKAYYTVTKKANGTEVQLLSKKHRKQEYLDAVKSQLLYFKNVKLFTETTSGYREEIRFQPKIFYEDDKIILSDDKQYSKPHLVINGVSYGYVNFAELELEEKLGNIGIKVEAEEVSINPSRESVVWNEQTRKTILTRFKEVAQLASSLIEKELKSPDFLKWLQTYWFAKSSYANDPTIIGRLAGLVDLENITPSFSLDSDLKISTITQLFPGINVQFVHATKETIGGRQERKLHRTDEKVLKWMKPSLPFYIVEGPASTESLQYLAVKHLDGFYLIQWTDTYSFDFEKLRKEEAVFTRELLEDRRKRVIKYIKASALSNLLSSVVVPAGFDFADSKEIAKEEATTHILTHEERRKLEERVVAFTPRGRGILPYAPNSKEPVNLYVWQKVQPKLKQVQSLIGDEIYYGTTEDTNLMGFAAMLSRHSSLAYYGGTYDNHYLYNDRLKARDELAIDGIGYETSFIDNWGPKARVTLVRASKDTIKYYKAYKPIQEFFVRQENGVMTSSPIVTNWYTSYLVNEKLDEVQFLQNFRRFNPEMKAKYDYLKCYVEEHFRELYQLTKNCYAEVNKENYNEFLDMQRRKMEYQLYRIQNPVMDEDTEELSKALFGGKVEQSIGVDLEVYNILNTVLDYGKPLAPMFNQMSVLVDDEDEIPDDTEAAIRSYMSLLGY